MTDIHALNAILVQLGGTTTYTRNIQAYNAWSVLQGGTGAYTRDIDALNAIDVLNGGSGGHKYNINALNSIDVAAGGTGGHTLDIAALTSLGALLNQPPAYNLATLWLDGTIIDVAGSKYFVDKKAGNNVLITGYDFPTGWVKGFPYKSAATIDIFGQTAVPVISLFQNFDYANQFFCKHVAQVVDGNGVETSEAYVSDIVAYSAPLTGDDLTEANTYYSVPAKGTAYWVAPTGSDAAAGSEAAPWQNPAKWDDTNDGSTIYQKTDPAIANNSSSAYLIFSTNFVYKTIGKVINTTVANTYGLRLRVAFNTIKGLIINSNATTYPVYSEALSVGSNIALEKLYLNVISSTANAINGFYKLLKNIIIKGSFSNAFILMTGTEAYTIQDSLFSGTSAGYGLDLNNSGTGVVKNNRFTGIAPEGMIRVRNDGLTILGNYFNCNSKKFVFVASGLNPIIKYNQVVLPVVTGNTAFISATGAQITAENNTISSVDNSGASVLACVDCDIEFNNNIANKGASLTAGTLWMLISITNATAKVVNITGNRIKINDIEDSYIILVGTDTADGNSGNNSCDLDISKNVIIGAWDGVSAYGCHSIFVGYQKNARVRYNRVSNAGWAILAEGQATTVDDVAGAGIAYNLLVDNYNGIISGGWFNQVIANNTLIYKNTLPANAAIYISESNNGADSDDIAIRNNLIVCNADGAFTAVYILNKLDNTCDYNVYYAKGTLQFKDGSNTYSFAEWQALGYDEHSIVLTEAQFNALFNDYANGDYSLKSGSAAIGAGVDLGATYDDGLDASTDWGDDTALPVIVTKQQAAAWDCGAYVH